jgi:hypothetical protein
MSGGSRASSITINQTEGEEECVTPTNETPKNLSLTKINTLAPLQSNLSTSKESHLSSASKRSVSEEEYFTAQSNFTSLSDISSSSKLSL